jgi:hypothetical protein
MASSKSLLRDALSANTVKDKGPPVVDGVLSITPDSPDVVEWRRSALNITETASTFLEDDDDGAWVAGALLLVPASLAHVRGTPYASAVGPRPNELFGKFTWKIENFSEISKRELRSNVFDVGNYKWCARAASQCGRLQPAPASCSLRSLHGRAGTSSSTPRAAMCATTSRCSYASPTMTSSCQV